MNQLFFNNKNIDIVDDNITKIKNIYFLYATSNISKSNKEMIDFDCVFAAHIEDNSIITFIKHYEEEYGCCNNLYELHNGGFVDSVDFNINIRKEVFFQSLFFLDGINDKFITDFNCTYDKDNNEFRFVAKDINNNFKLFSINKTILTGLNIIHNCINIGKLNNNCVLEANSWLTNVVQSRCMAEFGNVKYFDILEVSDSIRHGNKLYAGVVVIKFIYNTIHDIEKECILTIPYKRTKPLKKKYITNKISYLEKKYSDCFFIDDYIGKYISGCYEYQLIGINQQIDKYIILNISSDNYNDLYNALINISR